MFMILMNEDSTTVDSVQVYEIPEIIHFSFDSAIEKELHTTQNIVPEHYDLNLTEAISDSPYMLMNYGTGQLSTISRRGQDPRHTTIFLNNHRIDNPLFGYIDLTTLPIQFIENISVGQNYFGSEGINLTSKVNHYDTPFSYINFTTGDFGSNIYNIDFTRPITNDLGFYLSGLYWKSQGHRVNSHFEINSFYTNFYYNQILPMRFDIIYFSNDYGISGDITDIHYSKAEDKFIDACWICGDNEHKIALSYTSTKNQYTDTIAGSSQEHTIRNYGADINNYYSIDDFEIIYRFMGVLSKIESDFYGAHSVHSLNLFANVNKSFNAFLFSISNRGEIKNENKFFYAPKISVGINIFGSTYLFGSISRNYRNPSIAEMYAPYELFGPYGQVKGNSELLSEYYWSQEFGIKRKNSTLTFYKHDYDDLIVIQPNGNDYFMPHNIDSWQTIGVETCLEVPVRLSDHLGTSVTEISAGFSGNYIFKGDSLPFIPDGTARISLSLKRNTKRFGTSLTAKGEFVGHRQDMNGQLVDPFGIISVAGTIRFVTLSFTLRLDNIINEKYAYIPNYTMEPRHLKFSIRWEFWD